MGWHYQARKKTYIYSTFKETLYELVEVYPDLDAGASRPSQPAHTEDSVEVVGDSKEDLAKWLRIAAEDVERFDVIDGGTHYVKPNSPTRPTTFGK